jgi:tetratricopeptide (TPR) repeat protein/transcriptional regulator with XRE-family HTH domain
MTGTREIGRWLRECRETEGLTRDELSKLSGLSARTIANIERGTGSRPYPRTIRSLVSALRMSPTVADQLNAKYRLPQGNQPMSLSRLESFRGREVTEEPAIELPSAEASEKKAWLQNQKGVTRPLSQLPAVVTSFVSRSEEMAVMDEILMSARENACPMISIITGVPGIGKTALALRWAHLRLTEFPDGQLYVNLHGFDDTSNPVTPSEALSIAIRSFGIHPDYVPAQLDEKAAFYRSIIAGRRVLIVLDDAYNEDQVRYLLPGSSRCGLIVTSRTRLNGLVATHGFRMIQLKPLTEAASHCLLACQVGRTAPVQAVPVPRQLPASVRSFVGRQAEVGRLDGLLMQAAETAGGGGTVVISAIDGMAGVGKTALAIHAAHRLAGEFPDGQLFIDMHGYTQGHEPRPAGEALEVFLRALGVRPEWVPTGTDERAAMFRQRLADTRTMIVLDNAASEAQVRPLVPGSAGCLVLVTSRRRLRALDEAHVLSLDVLSRADALELFRAVAGPGRVPPDDPVLAEIVDLCGQLPLAVRIAAALLRHRPVWAPEHLARLLRAQQARISTLSDGERNLGAIFDLSYRSLTDAEQLTFRCLGLIPGPDFDSYATAALTGTDPSASARLLEDLVDHNLVIQHVPGRYRLHDLIRLHARVLADRDPVLVRDAALDRLMDYYQHTAGCADALISRFPRLAPAGPVPAHAPALPDADAGRAWLRAERASLLAVLRHATSHAQHERAVALTANMATLLRNDGPWPEALALHAGAIAAARSLGDRVGQAAALIQLGVVRNLTGDCPGALDALEHASQLYRELGDPLGQANALTQLGGIRGFVDDYPGAADDLEQALRLYQRLGNPLGQANALARLGDIRRYTGDFPGAIPDLEQALRLYQLLGNRNGQGSMLISLGNARRITGDFAGAARNLEEASRLYAHLDDQLGRANTLSELGELRRLSGDYPDAARYLEQGLQIYQGLGNRLGQANAQVWLGSVRQSTGDLPGAAQLLQAAIDTFRRIGSRGSEAWALNRYAAVISATGDLTRAENLYLEAMRLARETGQSDDEAHAWRAAANATCATERPRPVPRI